MVKRGVGLAGLLLLLSLPAAAQFEAGIPVGTQAPAVTINDLSGTPVELARLVAGKPSLIEFWATWCTLCKALLPQLTTIRQSFGDKVALVGVNVTVNDSKARVERYLAQHKPPFVPLYDDKGAGARAFDVPGTSFVVVLDRHGKVVYTGTGDKQDLVAAVRKAFQVP